ncbi:flagellar hook-length control protein FliK [Microvirga thermotolerans]|uniref:Flagellar hook-length control protein-like C-terminal domain-containing protein n=1 Tax=Microvirga thermotolerans TaxID=2651334 RepID=A0A5P9JXT9_9HYPH|nr:flagellar hook-length control protein FliK [Microvirga thermotolerans]QFU17672.1 hypothetical protein GDR74_16435 [Microvirga thermotolerans]
MNILEFLTPNAVSRPEAQSQRGAASDANGVSNGSALSQEPSFNGLLDSLSAKNSAETFSKGGLPPDGGQERGDLDPESIVDSKGEALRDRSTSSEPSPVSGQSDPHSLVQFLLPFVGQVRSAATDAGGARSTADPGSGPSRSMLLNDEWTASEMPDLQGGAGFKAKVLHQEAHFKPVLPSALSPETGKHNTTGRAGIDTRGIGVSLTGAASSGIAEASEADTLLTRAVGSGAKPDSATMEIASGDSERISGVSVYQQVADAVSSKLTDTAVEPEVHSSSAIAASPSIVLKPSEGVLRVLSIQLHPVELGVVTVKMRLSNDQLEMEIHTPSEETADILRRDVDKLSGLLRTSGYRADLVTIHVMRVDPAQQESSIRQGEPWNTQPQSNGFQQGQSGQHDGSRRSLSEQGETSLQVRGNAEREGGGGHAASGIYL